MINNIKVHLDHPIYWLKCIACGGLGYNLLGSYSDGEQRTKECSLCRGVGIMGKFEKTEYERLYEKD